VLEGVGLQGKRHSENLWFAHIEKKECNRK
jgi:hypothetical protein